jgi:hypothetical protein
VSKLKNANQEICTTITAEVDRLVEQVKTATVGEVKRSLQDTNDSINRSCNEFEHRLTTAVSTAEFQMKQAAEKYSQGVDKINAALDEKLQELNQKQKQFFTFEGAKSFFFWLSMIANFGTLGLLIHFLWGKK